MNHLNLHDITPTPPSLLMKILLVSGLTMLSLISFNSLAEELNFNLYNLNAQADMAVKNDLMKVTLSASHQANQAKKAADQVNREMSAALKLLDNKEHFTVKTGQYRTSPIYKDGKIVRWEASQRLHIETDQFTELTALLGDLQHQLKITSMSFQPKRSTKKAIDEQLMVKALEALKARAQLITDTMSADSYDIVNVSIHTSGEHFRPNYAMDEMHSGMRMKAMAAPVVNSGDSTLSVSVSGTIQLHY